MDENNVEKHLFAANHGAASGLLCQMWKLNSMSLKESFEQDLMNAGILSVADKFHRLMEKEQMKTKPKHLSCKRKVQT